MTDIEDEANAARRDAHRFYKLVGSEIVEITYDQHIRRDPAEGNPIFRQEIPGIGVVSTVFVGRDLSENDPPELFETLARFDDGLETVARSKTYDQAAAVQESMLSFIQRPRINHAYNSTIKDDAGWIGEYGND